MKDSSFIQNSKFKIQNFSLVIVLVIIGFFVYSFNLDNELFWDDTDWIVNNPFVHSFTFENIKNWFTQNILAGIGLSSNYYRPFLLFTFTFNYILGGENPIGYHLLSNLIHIANAILIFYLLLWIFKNKFVAFWSSLIWLVHPIQTEAVTYISGRGDPLNVFFMLLALWVFKKDIECPAPSYKLQAISYLILALLSRETAVIFPLLAMVLYISCASGDKFLKSVKSAFVKTVSYWGVVILYGILRLTVLNFENTLNFYSQSNPYTESLFVRLYTFLNVLWTYAGVMIWPLNQHMERSVTIYTYFWNFPVVSSLLAVLALLGWLGYLYKKENLSFKFRIKTQNSKLKTQNSEHFDFQIWFFGVGWFFVNLAMTSGITPINAQLYEHWLYLALLGPLVVVIFYIDKLRRQVLFLQQKRYLIPLVLAVIVIFFSFLSIKRNVLWGDKLEFFQDILKYEPESVRINNNVGNIYYDNGDIEKAEEYYEKASISNSFPQPHYNIGSILQSRGDIRGAIVRFERAIEIDPSFPYPYQNLAVIYAGQGDLAKAADSLEKLKKIVPSNPALYYNLALIYLKQGDNERAKINIEEGRKYGKYDPETGPLFDDLMEKIQ